MVCIVGAALAGVSLLLSAAESPVPVDGAVDWRTESPLRAVVQLLCLNYEFPTPHQDAVKQYVLGVGAGLAALTIGIAILLRRPRAVAGLPDVVTAPTGASPGGPSARALHVPPLAAAQVLLMLYLLWSFASTRWSAAPDLALGGSAILTIQFLWAVGIGNGLNRRAALIASRLVVLVTGLTAVVAIWYFYGRNPTLRAKFPFGNPTFLAAALIPGIVLAAATLCNRTGQALRAHGIGPLALALPASAAGALATWALLLTGARGAMLAGGVGIAALGFFALRGRARLVPVALIVLTLVSAGSYFTSRSESPSAHGRGATIRFRNYAWRYAWDMFKEKPLTGYGQGGFVLAGDARAVNDVLNDPPVFEARIAHAHNEWLEVMADLGLVGIALMLAALGLTFHTGMTALESALPYDQRWALAGSLAALLALGVEECFGVGLRAGGAPALFFTLVGLIWAFAAGRPNSLIVSVSASPARRWAGTALALAIALAILAVSHNDFAAARLAYRARQALRSESFEEAVRLAGAVGVRLNPQRAMEDLLLRSDVHVAAAAMYRRRAVDRETRARQGGFPDAQLRAVARQDRELSDSFCAEASRILKELVARSPGYFRHGHVEYELNLIRADNAAARDAREERDQYIKNAAAASERELLRRPFDVAVALEFLSVVGAEVEPSRKIEVLARPLRHQRLAGPQVELLAHMTEEPQFSQEFRRIVREARDELLSSHERAAPGERPESWAPEKLRLAATLRFRRGDYSGARTLMEIACAEYDVLAAAAPIGAAGSYAELAHCRFYANPNRPEDALESAARAVELAPESLGGRDLRQSVKFRMVDYYLAAGHEDEARSLLGESASSAADPRTLDRELGRRYRSLCEGLLGRRVASVLRKPPTDLLSKLQCWVRRAIELDPDDPVSHFIAADLAFHNGDCDAAAQHLRAALAGAIDVEVVRQFLHAAIEQGPECKSLEELSTSLTTPRPDSQTQHDLQTDEKPPLDPEIPQPQP